MTARGSLVLTCVWLAACASPAGAATAYTFHEIPIEPGLSGRQNATGVNENGVVCGNLITSPDYGFIWDQAGGAQYFNYGGPAGGEWHAEDINDQGEVTGFYGGPYAWRGHIWTNGSYTDLGQVPGYIETVPVAINNHGTVVGQTWIGAYTMGPPCAGSAPAGMRVLDGQFPDNSPATDINDAGQVVGYTGTGGSRSAWLYEAGTIQTLPHLSGGNSAAHGINQAGKVVGVSASRPVLWEGGPPHDLGLLGGASGEARAINDHGVIVGSAKDASGADRAFIWEAGQMHDLNDLVSLPAGWTLAGANDISTGGMIVGYGSRSGQQRAFALIPRPVLEVIIDIKPGSDPNSINLGSNGVVPVAILSSDGFDATTVDPLTIELAGAAVRLRGKGAPMASSEDVNGDGLLDMVLHVCTQGLELSEGDLEAELTGRTLEGIDVRGVDAVRIVGPMTPIPEPTALALLVVGGAASVRRKR